MTSSDDEIPPPPPPEEPAGRPQSLHLANDTDSEEEEGEVVRIASSPSSRKPPSPSLRKPPSPSSRLPSSSSVRKASSTSVRKASSPDIPDMSLSASQKWTQCFVSILQCRMQIEKQGNKLPLKGAVVVLNATDSQKNLFSVSFANKLQDVYYFQSQSEEQRQHWVSTLIDHGATVIMPPAKSTVPENTCPARGWMKFLPATQSNHPQEVSALRDATRKINLERQLPLILEADLAKANYECEQLRKELDAQRAQRRESSVDPATAKLKRENATLLAQLTKLEKQNQRREAKIAQLEQEKLEVLQNHNEEKQRSRQIEEQLAVGTARNASWSVMLSAEERASDNERKSGRSDNELEELRNEVNRLMEANKALIDELNHARDNKEVARRQNKTDAKNIALKEENERLEAELCAMETRQRELEAGAEELIETMEQEKQQLVDELERLKATVSTETVPQASSSPLDEGVEVEGVEGVKPFARVSHYGYAQELLRQLDHHDDGMKAESSEAALKQLQDENRALLDELCDSKIENEDLLTQLTQVTEAHKKEETMGG